MRAWRQAVIAAVIFALLGIGVGCSESSSPSGPDEDWVLAGFFSVNPAATFLHTCGDFAADVEPIVLADHGLSPGESIRIEVVGLFCFGGGGEDTEDSLEAVFSSSNTLLGAGELNRVPDAIDAGADYESSPTYACEGEPTDIPEDFACDPEVSLTIPAGATHLFLSTRDVYFGDNSDVDGDFGINVWRSE